MASENTQQPEKHMIDVMGRKFLWFAISGAYLIPCIIAIIVCLNQFGAPVKLGIDFTGGTLMEATYTQSVAPDKIKQVLKDQQVDANLQPSSDNKTFLIRSKFMDKAKTTMIKAELEKVGTLNQKAFRLESVGPTIGKELLQNAAMALGIGILAILLYISFRYQFDFALAAISAMVHDVLVMLGTFSILSLTRGAEADGLLVVALLTIMGFSVHDTIVIFDRFRENLKFAKKGDRFEDVANRSINQTFARSINTSLTLVLTLLPLVVLGGPQIFFFTFVMLIGVLSGTYSSIFNAAPLLVLMRDRGKKKTTVVATA